MLAFLLTFCSLLACLFARFWLAFLFVFLLVFFQVDLLDAAKLSYICCKDITEFLRKIVNSLCSC